MIFAGLSDLIAFDFDRAPVPKCVAECCRMVQCVAVCCSVLPCVAVWCRVEHSMILAGHSALNAFDFDYAPVPKVCCIVLQCIAVCCSVLQCVVVCALQCVALRNFGRTQLPHRVQF